MHFSFPALFACLSFYSALYLIFFFFVKHSNPIFLILAIILLIISWKVTPYSYERNRERYDKTMSWGQYLAIPLMMWGRMFMLPIRWIMSFFYD